MAYRQKYLTSLIPHHPKPKIKIIIYCPLEIMHLNQNNFGTSKYFSPLISNYLTY